MKNSLPNYFLGIAIACILLCFGGCKEEIDDSNFAIKTEQTAADFLDTNPEYSMIRSLFMRVTLGSSSEASSLYSVLSARGNYTLFLPTDDAMRVFLSENGISSIEEMDDALASTVALNSIIDNGDETAYTTPEFPVAGPFQRPSLSDRLLNCELGDDSRYVINGTSVVIDEDVEVSNGYIHTVDHAIAPSINKLADMIAEADNMKVFSYLLKLTTWSDSLTEVLDEEYEKVEREEVFTLDASHKYDIMQHRYLGYTAFVEPDSIYEQACGLQVELDENGALKNGEAFVEKLRDLVASAYGREQAENFAHPDNALNRFVAYHLLDGKLSYNNMVMHGSEYSYKVGDPTNPQLTNLPVNVWDYYVTKGKHRGIMQITQVGDTGFEHDMTHPICINRISFYADGPEDDYRELGVAPGCEGVKISPTNGANDNNSLNGFYFPVNKLLVYDPVFRDELSKQRMRIEFTTLLPELYSNNLRGPRGQYHMDNDFYSNILNVSIGTQLLYTQYIADATWNEFRCDAVEAAGLYDVTVRLPPVPKDGTYELRLWGSQNYIVRSMCQIYFGDNPGGLMPAGLPYDMRQPVGGDNFDIPWVEDTEDWTVNFENDKNLRNHGYLKGPQYVCQANGKGDRPVRQVGGTWGCVRRIITTADMRADKTYYLRFKSVLKKTTARLWLDFLEIVPKSVYNGAEQEDIW